MEACKAPGSATDTILIAMSIVLACGLARWDRSSLLLVLGTIMLVHGVMVSWCHGGETSAKDGVADVGGL